MSCNNNGYNSPQVGGCPHCRNSTVEGYKPSHSYMAPPVSGFRSPFDIALQQRWCSVCSSCPPPQPPQNLGPGGQHNPHSHSSGPHTMPGGHGYAQGHMGAGGY